MRVVLAEATQFTFFHFAHEEELIDAIDHPEWEGKVSRTDIFRGAPESVQIGMRILVGLRSVDGT